MTSLRTTKTTLAALAVLALLGAACSSGSDSTGTAAGDTSTTASDNGTSSTTAMDNGGSSGSSTASMTPSGPACSAIPTSGKGSSAGMAQDPVATAASNNPVLSTLVKAVQAAGLVDTLNNGGPFTIFAPSNDAFAKIPADQLNMVLGNKELLTKILTLHVVPDKSLDASALSGMSTLPTVNGQQITVSGSEDQLMINGQAKVVCGNVQTANATVFIIDTVLMPEGM